MECAHCINTNCEYNDLNFEDNCSASDHICNKCEDADWDDEVHIAAVTLGTKGGSVKSDRKTTASRENGRKGGRPKKRGR